MPANQNAAGNGLGLGGNISTSNFTKNQLLFIDELALQTGLDAGVIAAWTYAEENGSAASTRETQGYNNWLNIGWADSGRTSITFDKAWNGPTSAADVTAKWLAGKWGNHYSYVAASTIQAILKSAGQSATNQIKAIQKSGWASSGYPLLAQVYGQLSGTFIKKLAGAAGLGGAGTKANTGQNAAAFKVSATNNPNQDYWTSINNYTQQAYWYFFSDGELLYVADGYEIMQQAPVAIISPPWLDSNCLHLDFTYDNTAYQYASTHKRRGHVQRNSNLAKVTSPVGADVQYICPIDAIRAGDLVQVVGTGPGDMLWLVGDCTRSVFQVYSQLTLVPPVTPQALNSSSSNVSAADASKSGSGTAIAAMLSAAATINNQDWPYEYGGGHATAGTPDKGISGGNHEGGFGNIGYDCSGAVGAVLAAGGIWKPGSSVPASNSIVDELLQQKLVLPHGGNRKPSCTLYDTPNHIFMRLNGEFWGTEDGAGNLPATKKHGVGWIPHGSAGSGFRVTHVPTSLLIQAVT